MKILLLAFLITSINVYAQDILEYAVTDKGMPVTLYKNGTWVFSKRESSGLGNEITHFFRIPFGASKADAIKLCAERGIEMVKEEKQAYGEYITFHDVNFSGREAGLMYLKFVDDQLFEGAVHFFPYPEAKIIELYDQIEDELNEVYFKGERFESFKNPFEKGDGYELTAIKTGKASFATYWISENASISLETTHRMTIRLKYQDNKLIEKAASDQKEVNYKDY